MLEVDKNILILLTVSNILLRKKNLNIKKIWIKF